MADTTHMYTMGSLELALNRTTLMEVQYYGQQYSIDLDEFVEIGIEFTNFVLRASRYDSFSKNMRFAVYGLATGLPEALQIVKEACAKIEDSQDPLNGVEMELQAHLPRDEWQDPKQKFGTGAVKRDTGRKSLIQTSGMWDAFEAQKQQYDKLLKQLDHQNWPRTHAKSKETLVIKLNSQVLSEFERNAKGFDTTVSRAAIDSVKNVLLLLKLVPQVRSNDLKADLVRIMLQCRAFSERLIRLSMVMVANVQQERSVERVLQTRGLLLAKQVKSGHNLHHQPVDTFARIVQAKKEGNSFAKISGLPNYLD